MADDFLKRLIIRLQLDAKGFKKQTDEAGKGVEGFEKKTKKAGASLTGLAVGLGAPALAITKVAKAFGSYEQALIGVGKTADLSGQELEDFGRQIQLISREVPIATNELLGIAQAGAQLGVKGTQNLLLFSKTIAQLGQASNLSGEEAATSLVRILNVTSEGVGEIDRFGSQIVALGNNFAATESEIASSTTRVAQAAAQFNISSGEAAALGTALRSVGVEAERSGGVVSRSFQAIQTAILEGGDAFAELERLTGLTGDTLRKAFSEDASGVFLRFLEGLKERGDGVTSTLETFGLRGTEVASTLPLLASRTDIYAEALRVVQAEQELFNKGLGDQGALAQEADKQNKTFSAQIERTGNILKNVGTDIGAIVAPSLLKLNDILKASAVFFRDELPGAIQATQVILSTRLAQAPAAIKKAFLELVLSLAESISAIDKSFRKIPVFIQRVALEAQKFFISKFILPIEDRFREFVETIAETTSILPFIGDNIEKSLKSFANNDAAESIKEIDASIAGLRDTLKGIDAKENPLVEGLRGGIESTRKEIELLQSDAEAVLEEIAIGQERINQQRKEEEAKKTKPTTETGSDTPDASQILTGLESGETAIDDLSPAEQDVLQQKLANDALRELVAERNQIILEGRKRQIQLQSVEGLQELGVDPETLPLLEQVALGILSLEEAVEQDPEVLGEIAKNERLQEILAEQLGIEKTAFDALIKQEQEKQKQREELQKKSFETRLKDTSEFFANLATLTESNNKKLTDISKAFAITETVISTYKTAQKAFENAFEVYGRTPQALAIGVAQAAFAVSTGLARVQQIKRAQTGGIVGGSGRGDSQLMALEPGELVVPRQFVPRLTPTFQQIMSGGEAEESTAGSNVTVNIELSDDAAQLITANQRENNDLGI